MKVVLDAYAKINLGLRVISKRTDGYHDLLTVFQRISLSDRVTLVRNEKDIVYLGPSLTDDPTDNLCYKAAEAFQNRFGTELGVKIELEKNIPSGAGLGGGSSDAATVLKGMLELYGIRHSLEDLLSLATEIGSDVSFFASGFSAALGQEKGERLSRVCGLSSEDHVLIVKPDFDISTGWAYQLLDDHLTFDKKNIKILSYDFLGYTSGLPTALMTNDFETPVFSAYSGLGDARNRILSRGAKSAGLCGSGSALYGVFEDGDSIGAIADDFGPPWLTFICHPF